MHLVVLLPLCAILLPESPSWLRTHGRDHGNTLRVARTRHLAPKLMGSDARFDLGDPLHFLLALNIGAVINHYPPELRGTSLGFALGVGRIGAVLAPQVGGWLPAANLGVGSNFLAFAVAAAVASLLLLATMLVTRRPARGPCQARDHMTIG